MPKIRFSIIHTILVCKIFYRMQWNFYGVKYFFQKCFKFLILDIYKCPFLKYLKGFGQNGFFVTIINFYGVAIKVFLKMLLPYVFSEARGHVIQIWITFG